MEATLEAVARATFGKNEARRLRRQGRIPAVMYGPASATDRGTPAPIAVDPKVLLRILHSEAGVNTLIGLRMADGAETRVLVKQYQLDPVSRQILHADFYRIAMDRAIMITVPIILKGEAPGVKQQGGLIDFVHREIEITCLPGDIPEHVEVDVSNLMLNQGVRLRDVAADQKWSPVTDGDTLLVHVIAPKAEEVPAVVEAAPAAAAEPEVIKKGKVEKPEGEA
ncbi:MAG TPA: 50S ribosomal protein L25 [Vicinamibacterales bacterium]|nr:50S ribosomal protein L25 [Vicinamibacterales bacterium]